MDLKKAGGGDGDFKKRKSGGITQSTLLQWAKKPASASCSDSQVLATLVATNKNNELPAVNSSSVVVVGSANASGFSGSSGPPPAKKIKVDLAAAMLKYSSWIADQAFICNAFDPPEACFVLASDKGIRCKFCALHDVGAVASAKSDQQQYGALSAFPTQKKAMAKHLESGRHKASVVTEKTRRTSILEKQAVQVKEVTQQTVADRINSIYFIAKNEVANRKFRSLQDLIDRIGRNENLKNFGHDSSKSVYEFLVYIADYLLQGHVANAKASGYWASLVDETTDVTTLQQYITFVRYVHKGVPKTFFLDIRPLDTGGATAINIYNTWKQVADDYGLVEQQNIANATDGAHAMVGEHNSLGQKIKAANDRVVNMHCSAHRAALSAADGSDALAEITDMEALLLTVWKYYHRSCKRTENLSECKRVLGTKGLRLKARSNTRWLSGQAAGIAMKSEINAIWMSLTHFATSGGGDASADGILRKLRCKRFVKSLYIYCQAVNIMNIMNKTFQVGELNFSMLKPAVDACKAGLEKIMRDDSALKELQECWSERFEADLGQLNEADALSMSALTKRYIKKLVASLDTRFPDHDILTLFGVFDPADIPDTVEERADYGDSQIDKLCTKFKLPKATAKLHFHSFIEFVFNTPSLKTCKTAGDLCTKVLCQEERFAMYPEVVELMKIAMTIPLSTAWPERGFSALKRVKSFMRNRLLTAMLNALLQISLNGPRVLSDEQANAIAEKWLGERKRRKVTPRGMRGVMEYGKLEEQKMVQQTEEDDDEGLDFDGFAEEESHPWHSVASFDDADFIDDAATTFWM